jgi:hypothetical protein
LRGGAWIRRGGLALSWVVRGVFSAPVAVHNSHAIPLQPRLAAHFCRSAPPARPPQASARRPRWCSPSRTPPRAATAPPRASRSRRGFGWTTAAGWTLSCWTPTTRCPDCRRRGCSVRCAERRHRAPPPAGPAAPQSAPGQAVAWFSLPCACWHANALPVHRGSPGRLAPDHLDCPRTAPQVPRTSTPPDCPATAPPLRRTSSIWRRPSKPPPRCKAPPAARHPSALAAPPPAARQRQAAGARARAARARRR